MTHPVLHLGYFLAMSRKPTLVRPSFEVGAVRFEDVPEILRLVARAITFGCREHYDPVQRAAVYANYARVMFVEWREPFDSVVRKIGGRIVGYAQLDPAGGRLRALFVDADCQGQGVGRALLANVEERAARRGCTRLHGAMSLNAVAFYERCGFRALGDAQPLASGGVAVPIVRMEKRLPARL
jgi:GNAT superfamily N-acetyltransferase